MAIKLIALLVMFAACVVFATETTEAGVNIGTESQAATTETMKGEKLGENGGVVQHALCAGVFCVTSRRRRPGNGSHDWKQCLSEVGVNPPFPHTAFSPLWHRQSARDLTACVEHQGGTKNCAICDNSGSKGHLPCNNIDATTTSGGWRRRSTQNKVTFCPDDKIWQGRKFFRIDTADGVHGGQGKCIDLSAAVESNGDARLKGTSSTAFGKFKNLGSSGYVQSKNYIAHPSSDTMGLAAVVFKRIVTHICTGHRPNSCTAGTVVADVFKVGNCIKCPMNIYSNKWESNAKDSEGGKFIRDCLPNAFSTDGTVKAGYRCTSESDRKAAAAVITGF